MSAPYWSAGAVTIWNANALALPLPDASVDLVVTSPPYWSLRSYRDGGEHYDGQIGDESTPGEFVDALIAATVEMIRVLKPSGSIWVNLGDKYGPDKSLMGLPWRYAIRCTDDLGLTLRSEVIWSKSHCMPEAVTDRVRRTHEQWFHFTAGPQYFSSMDEIREAYEGRPQRRFSPRIKDRRDEGRPAAGWDVRWDTPTAGENPLGKLPGSVWEIPPEQLKVPPHLPQHFAAFPLEWPRRIIRGWCPDGGVVLDPFSGTGTVGVVAKALGCRAHLVDLSRDYCAVAKWRVNDSGEMARAMQVDKPPATPDDMDSLLDLISEEGVA